MHVTKLITAILQCCNSRFFVGFLTRPEWTWKFHVFSSRKCMLTNHPKKQKRKACWFEEIYCYLCSVDSSKCIRYTCWIPDAVGVCLSPIPNLCTRILHFLCHLEGEARGYLRKILRPSHWWKIEMSYYHLILSLFPNYISWTKYNLNKLLGRALQNYWRHVPVPYGMTRGNVPAPYSPC